MRWITQGAQQRGHDAVNLSEFFVDNVCSVCTHNEFGGRARKMCIPSVVLPERLL
jgi:hypothetical protein